MQLLRMAGEKAHACRVDLKGNKIVYGGIFWVFLTYFSRQMGFILIHSDFSSQKDIYGISIVLTIT